MELNKLIEEFEVEHQVKIVSKGTVLYEGKVGTLDTLLHATLVNRGSKLENNNVIVEVVRNGKCKKKNYTRSNCFNHLDLI